MRETSSPPSEMCFITLPPVRGWLSANRGSREGGSPCPGRDWQGLPGAGARVCAGVVETKHESGEFLTSRRALITPEQAGLRSYGSRRVPGLRREEVAVLAGVSVPYYTRLERGDMNGVSQSVLEALARALELDDAERAHLFDLSRAAQPAIV